MKNYNLASFLTGFLALILLVGTASFDVIADDTGTSLDTANVAPTFDLDPFDYKTTTQLDGGISGGATTITVDSTAGFNASGGTIKINDEQDITYTGKTATTLTGVSNVSSAHSDNDTVYLAADANNPIDFGDTGTWIATATDDNTDDYYLTACLIGPAIAGTSAAPTCTLFQYCVSSQTSSGTATTCTLDASNATGEGGQWNAFACDHNSSGECSSGNSTNSEMNVNHAPIVESYGATDTSGGTIEPGETVRFYAKVYDYDYYGGADELNFAVCTDGSTFNTADPTSPCSGGTLLCSETGVSHSMANATITLSGQPADGDTLTINGDVYEFDPSANGIVTGGATEIATDGCSTLNCLTDRILQTINTSDVFVIKGTVVDDTELDIVAVEPGTAGNSIAVSESSSALSLSGATLSGGTTTGNIDGSGNIYCDDTDLAPIPTAAGANSVEYFVWDEHEERGEFNEVQWLAFPSTTVQTSLVMSSTTLFPSSGDVVVGKEKASYTGKNTGSSLDGVTGLSESHSANTPVVVYGVSKPSDPTVTDGDMEAAGTTAWGTSGSGTLSKVADERTGGSGSQSLSVASTSADFTATQSVGTAGVTATVTGWAKTNGAGGCAFVSGIGATTPITTSTTWTRFAVTGAIASDLNLGIGCGASSGSTAFFDDIEVIFYQYTVANVAPVLNSFTITGDGSGDFNPTAGTTTNFVWSAEVSDNNGDDDVVTTIGAIYDANAADEGNDEGTVDCVTDTGTNTDAQQECYDVFGCTLSNQSGAGTDENYTVTCDVDVQFNIAPSSGWTAAIYSADKGGLFAFSDSQTVSTLTHTVAELLALDTRDASDGTSNTDLQYGTLAPGGDTGTLSEVFYIANVGNTSFDTYLYGTDMCNNWGTPYTVCSGDSFSVSQQEFSETASTNYGSGSSVNLSASQDCINNNVPVRDINTNNAGSDPVYFGIQLPESVASGTYTGQNTITAASATGSCGS